MSSDKGSKTKQPGSSTSHNTKEEQAYRCNYCLKKFKNYTELKNHEGNCVYKVYGDLDGAWISAVRNRKKGK